MAYVNVKDWSVDQVTEWLKGLDNAVAPYTKSFLNNEVRGHQLLNLRSDDLEHLGVVTLGHQETILEAAEHLRNFHYELDRENLQFLALRLSCAANSLCKALSLTDDDCTMVPTQTMSDVHNVITTIKPLVCWLDRSPFCGNKDYIDNKTQLLQLSFEMATSAHRDIFSEKPLRSIRNISETLAKLADHIIQEINDPMILQPASLALATLKKKEQEIGFFLLPGNSAIHQIAEIKYGSPAHISSKIEEGDEIVQVNYQTVVGWQRKKVLLLLQESPPEIVLTLKKRPRHTKVYGQIYMKPYRLPSKKRAMPYSRWNDNLPSPQLLAMHDLPQILPPAPKVTPLAAQQALETETSSSSSSDSEPLDSPLDGGGRVYPLKPRPVLQRRNTVTGASPTSKRPNQAIEQYWQLLKNQAASKHASSYNIQTDKYSEESLLLRDKSVSCSVGLELAPRPTTVIGLTQGRSAGNFKREKSLGKKKVNFEDKPTTKCLSTNLNEQNSISINSLTSLNEAINFIDEGEDLMDRSSMKAEWQKEIIEEIIDKINFEPGVPPKCPDGPRDTFANVHVHNIIKKFDVDAKTMLAPPKPIKPKVFPRYHVEKPPEIPQKPDFSKKPAVPLKINASKVRGSLNKSHSTPAYDQTSEDDLKSELEKTVLEVETLVEEKETTKFSNLPIKYELGIPVVEEIEPICAMESEANNFKNSRENLKDLHDIPPKPPPRTSTLCDSYKPKYPAGSPKPLNFVETICKTPGPPSCEPKKAADGLTKLSYDLEKHPPHSASFHSIDHFLKPSGCAKYVSANDLHIFEPKIVSTPISKCVKMDLVEGEAPLHAKNFVGEVMRPSEKISPTNSVVRAMIYSSKNKAAKKKNTLIAKRRKVAVKDIAPGEFHGYLYQRLRSKATQNVHWEKRWFVLTSSYLYGFKSRHALKAECLIFLSGFTVSIANEVKSRTNAFKVYHTGTVFYFSAEDTESLTTWMELITAATVSQDLSKTTDSSLYSETDESDDEKPKLENSEKPTEAVNMFGSLKKFTAGKTTTGLSPSGSSSLDRKWFFNKANSICKTSVPVPTAQFRSYRKMPSSVSTGNFTSHIPNFSSQVDELQIISSPNLVVEPSSKKHVEEKAPKGKPKPINYVHVSNPNLCEVTEFYPRSIHKLHTRPQGGDNLSGLMTLEELMNRQKEEQKLNPHSIDEVVINPNLIRPDVVYGELPIRPSHNNDCGPTAPEKPDSTSFCFGKRSSSCKKHKKDDSNHSLPRTHKVHEYQELLPKRNLSEPIYADKKLLRKNNYSASSGNLKEQPCEMVYCPQTVNDVQFAQNRSLDAKMCFELPRKSANRMSGKKNQKAFTYGESTEKFWLDSLQKSDKVGDRSVSKVKLKSAGQYTPMSLPLTPDQKARLNPKFAFELNLDEKATKGGKLKNLFGKQGEGKKEKTFLGSPKLHRAVFGSKQGQVSDLDWPSGAVQLHTRPALNSFYSMEDSPELKTSDVTPPLHASPTADYPGLEYPPVFEPETYSLSDPQSSITLLRRHEKNDKIK